MSSGTRRAEPDSVRRVMVATDGSETAKRAVSWAAAMAGHYEAELLLVRVIDPEAAGSESAARAEAHVAERELQELAAEIAGSRGLARVAVDDDPAAALLDVAAEYAVDTLVVGNVGMRGRKKFLLGNIPNRISHNAACNVVIVNTSGDAEPPTVDAATYRMSPAAASPKPHMVGRAAEIGTVMARHGIEEIFARHDGIEAQKAQARRLRKALEELGPTFAKLGQILSTRPDLLPAPYIDELSRLQDHVPPLGEAEVVEVMEEELGVPWEDVFDSLESDPLAAGTIAQVHRATLEEGDHVVIKVQRPKARAEIMEDLELLRLFVDKAKDRPRLRHIIDMEAVFEHLSESLQRELDFNLEARNIRRMRSMLEPYSRLDAPAVYDDLTSSRLLVMEEVRGVPIREAPEGAACVEAARQLLESYYQQILSDGFFHADPHPGNLMWWNDRIYFLDFGMVGELGPDLRESLMLLLLAFWQEDVGFLSDVTLSLAGDTEHLDLDFDRFREQLGELLAEYRNVPLREIQLGPILQQMTEISIQHGVPLPASLTLTAKAMAQMQQTASELDPDLDPFEVAGSFLMRTVARQVRETINPRRIFYESQKLKVRIVRLIEAFERLTGAKPGPKLQVNFRAERLESILHKTGRRLSLGTAASASLLAAARMSDSKGIPRSVPAMLAVIGSGLALRLLADLADKDVA